MYPNVYPYVYACMGVYIYIFLTQFYSWLRSVSSTYFFNILFISFLVLPKFGSMAAVNVLTVLFLFYIFYFLMIFYYLSGSCVMGVTIEWYVLDVNCANLDRHFSHKLAGNKCIKGTSLLFEGDIITNRLQCTVECDVK